MYCSSEESFAGDGVEVTSCVFSEDKFTVGGGGGGQCHFQDIQVCQQNVCRGEWHLLLFVRTALLGAWKDRFLRIKRE